MSTCSRQDVPTPAEGLGSTIPVRGGCVVQLISLSKPKSFTQLSSIFSSVLSIFLYIREDPTSKLLRTPRPQSHYQCAPRTQAASHLEPPSESNDGCAFSGNFDLYGLGIRLGVYFQCASALVIYGWYPEGKDELAENYFVFLCAHRGDYCYNCTRRADIRG